MLSTTPVRGGGAYATAHTTAMGTNAERRFYDGCMNKGWNIRQSSSYENRVRHYDFEVNGDYIEVKAMKAPRRGMAPDPSIIYLELKNIEGGEGWLYGDADFIAFEQPSGFLVVCRTELVSLAERMMSRCRRVHVSGEYNTLYSRANRSDLVMVLHIDDIHRLRNKFKMYV
jgi:hypothetical protein